MKNGKNGKKVPKEHTESLKETIKQPVKPRGKVKYPKKGKKGWAEGI